MFHLIECNIRTDLGANRYNGKWIQFVDGGNGYLYGIPCAASRVLEFNVEDKSIKEIGPDLITERGINRYLSIVKGKNGSIYCSPILANQFLKITPKEGGGADVQIIRTWNEFMLSWSPR